MRDAPEHDQGDEMIDLPSRVLDLFFDSNGDRRPGVELTRDEIGDRLGLPPTPEGCSGRRGDPRRGCDSAVGRLTKTGTLAVVGKTGRSLAYAAMVPTRPQRRALRAGYSTPWHLAKAAETYERLIRRPHLTSAILLARVVAASQRAGLNLTEVAKAAGMPRSALTRRLDLDAERPLRISHLDAVQTALDLEPDELLRPVFLDGDAELLTAANDLLLYGGDGDIVNGLRALPASMDGRFSPEWYACARARLCAQGLAWLLPVTLVRAPEGEPITERAGDPVLVPSAAGLQALADPSIRTT